MREATRPKEPTPEDFGMTSAEYQEAKATLKRQASTREPFSRWWIVAFVFVGLSLLLNSAFAVFLFMLSWGTAQLMDYVTQRAAKREEKAQRNNLLEKIRPYEQAVVAYEQELARYNHRREQYWMSLGGVAFENELAAVYRTLGYGVETTKATGDQGIDLILTKNGATVLVQCKGHRRPIGVGAIRDLYGTLIHHKADRAVLACPAGFTQGVIDFVEGKPIDLISARELVRMAENTQLETLQQPSDHTAVGAAR
jgi:hypothetical protein